MLFSTGITSDTGTRKEVPPPEERCMLVDSPAEKKVESEEGCNQVEGMAVTVCFSRRFLPFPVQRDEDDVGRQGEAAEVLGRVYCPGYEDAEQGEVPAPEGAWAVEGGLEVGGLERWVVIAWIRRHWLFWRLSSSLCSTLFIARYKYICSRR